MKEGGILAGKYLLERQLARGGMGSVWFARHTQLGTPVAVKFMDGALAAMPELRTRFEREARAGAFLQSPHVVRVLDYGLDSGVPYIAMELLTGETLSARLKRERRMALPAVASVVSQVAKALRRAHEAGIIHRDLKPQNIFLAREDDDEVVKVLDFGIAKMLLGGSASDTSTGTLLGSPSYMSPEQVRRSREVDHRSDLWSLAVVAYRALTGRLPFPGDEVGDIIVRICTERVPPASSIDSSLGPEVDAFFARALTINPDQRFQSATELAVQFSQLAGRPSLLAPAPAQAGDVTSVAASTGPGTRLDGTSNTPAAQALTVADEGTLAHATAGSDVRAGRASNRAGLAVLAASLATIALVSMGVWALVSRGSGPSSAAQPVNAPSPAAQPVESPVQAAPADRAPEAAPAPAAPRPEEAAAASAAPEPAAATSAAATAKPSAEPSARARAPKASPPPAAAPQAQPRPASTSAAASGPPKKPSTVLGF